MNIAKIISAVGNINSPYPLLVRDCGVEAPTKIALTYKQNKSDPTVAMLATRERFIDEYSTSAVWLGGIPLLEKISKTIIKKAGFNPDISPQLLKSDPLQNLETNINNFRDKAPDAVKDLEKLKLNKNKYMKLIFGKVCSETFIPMLLMGFIIPKLIFAWTAKTKEKLAKAKEETKNKEIEKANNKFIQSKTKTMIDFTDKKPAFKGLVLDMANMSTLQKMMTTDGGYAVGRIVTARNKDAAIDIGFKMLVMYYLNFRFPKVLAKFLDSKAEKMFKTNLDLDIKMFNDSEFIDALKNKKLELPNIKTNKELLEFIDKNPNNLFVKFANKYEKIKLLPNGIRDPRSFIDFKELNKFLNGLTYLSEKAFKVQDIEKFIKKTNIVKAVNVFANVAISSFLLAYALPKTQFAFRKIFIKKILEPGIADE